MTPSASDYPDALTAVSGLWSRLVAAVVAALGLSHDQAEDAVAEVVVRVLERGLAPDEGTTWFTYLHAAVINQGRNAALSESRRADREVRFFLTRGHDVMTDSVAVTTALLSAVTDFNEVLSEEERLVFRLKEYEQLTWAEIAARTGWPEGGARSRYRQARAKLAARQAEREADPAWLPLLAVLRPWAERLTRVPADATLTASPFAAAVAAMSIVVAVGAPPAGVRSIPQRVPASVAAQRGAASAGISRPEGGGSGVAAYPVRGQAPHVPGAPASAPPASEGTRACALVVCVEPTPTPSASPSPGPRKGDGIVVTGVPYGLRQRVTPLCWSVPDQDWVTCEAGDPGTYMVEAGQESPAPTANSHPSTPRPWESSKGTQP